MSDPIHERILAGVQSALAGISAVAGLEVERERDHEVTDADLPRLMVYEGETVPASAFTGEDGYTLIVSIEGYAGGADTLAAKKDAAALRAHAMAVLTNGLNVEGHVLPVELSDEPAVARVPLETVGPIAGFVFDVTITFATAEGDPFNWP